ncbi:E3 ubiquitin-protein ligase ATL42-like [Juglans microcarpa x Juglans regia]|uniref:E3 ubiquitin-protein ligase ATL42-like n=1 Tax=Juglans microcarpa x Juglans regia TaxID=2249226 RepID=UPI001B7DA121|nr:E3 ubiquitin-protein ligase ATL42-like [Juglans microcarpa x Juglans regia]
MNRLSLLILQLNFMFFLVKAQSSPNQGDGPRKFQPSLGVVLGILLIMFSVTVLLLLYAKFYHRRGFVHGNTQNFGFLRSSSRFSGIDKTVIESLPFFRFSSLKGTKDGLECSVCLSKFEDAEILRLLPKCKHAFHIECIDNWLVKHSSCPLCRHRVSAEDPSIFTYTNSMRLMEQSERRVDSNIELFVQREDENRGSSRFSIGSSFRKAEKGSNTNKEEKSLIQEEDGGGDEDHHKVLHKHNHKIIVSDFVFKNRWSSVSSSDLIFLNSEMITAMSSNRFSSLTLDSNNEQFSTARGVENEQVKTIKEEMEMKRSFESKISTLSNTGPVLLPGLASASDFAVNISQTSRLMNPGERRSMSEITALSRHGDSGMIKSRIEESYIVGNGVKEERIRRLWLPIARRTVQWYANRERRSQQNQKTPQALDV